MSVLFVQERPELLVLGADMAHQQAHMPVELRKVRNAAIIGHSGCYFTQGLLVLLVERMVRFISRVAALLLKLLLMREMAVNVVVQELYSAAHLGASLAGAACVKQRVDGVQEFTVLIINDSVSCFKILC